LDNRRRNLRVVEANKNSKYRQSKNKNNKSGYRNVFYDKRRNKYIVRLQVDGKGTELGSFNNVDEAGKFAEEMRKKYYGKFAGNG
jgi:AP2 domain.